MENKIENIKKELESGFFGFWTSKLKVTFLVLLILVIFGIFSLFMIPKESIPKVEVGFISVTTVYNGVSPEDIDSLITEPIEKKLKDIKGIKKITSNSSVGISSINLEVETRANIKDVLNDVKVEIDKVSLPSSVERPSVVSIDTTLNTLFTVYLYDENKKYSTFELIQKAKFIKQRLEESSYISQVSISPGSDYKIKVLIDKSKLEQIGLSISEIANSIRANNQNNPIGNYKVGDLKYDFSFKGKLEDIEDLKNIVIKSDKSSFVKLSDIAEISKDYELTSVNKLGFYEKKGFDFVSLTVDKSNSVSVFSGASFAKQELEKILSENKELEGLKISYFLDLSEIIKSSYSDLASTAIQTFILVFLTILFFISFKESIISIIILPLSFFVTFIFLYYGGYTLNTMTNFSLVLSLTIGIDTVIVIVEAAAEKQKIGYNKKYAVLLAIKEFKAPLISGTLTTLAVFLPMLALPGAMGKFMSYIPLTVFSTLLAGLVISLTLSSAIYMALAKEKTTFFREEEIEKNMTEEQKIFLESQREGKREVNHHTLTKKEKILENMGKKYFNYLQNTLKSKKKRKIIIWLPIILTILAVVILPSRIGFSLFSGSSEGTISVTALSKNGTTKEYLEKYLPEIEEKLSSLKEIENFAISVSGNQISIDIKIFDENDNLKNIGKIEKNISDKINFLEKNGLKLSISGKTSGPSSNGGALGVTLISKNNSKNADLKKVVDDFEKYIKSIDGVKNVKSSASDSPGQFIFQFDKNKLAELGLSQNEILGELYTYIAGTSAGNIKSEFEDNEIFLKIKDFENDFSPENLLNISINTRVGKIRVGDLVIYDFTKSVSSISREDGKVAISISAGVEDGFLPSDIQPKIDNFMLNYNYPEGIFYEAGGENAENSELISSMISALFIAIFLMFFILVNQFNSYKQPSLILFSVILSILGVLVGLFVTKTPIGMMVMIGFVSLAGIVVNDAIILIDRANKNIEKGLEPIMAISLAGQSRLQPILVTTITTVLGVLPMALQDEMWAGLGYTIMFGLFTGSMLTIFCVPLIYYNIYLKENGEKKAGIIKKIFLFIFWPLKKIFSLIFRRKKS